MVKNLPANAGDARDMVQSLGWEDPLEQEIVTHCSILAWKFHGLRSLTGDNPYGLKESDMNEQLSTHIHIFRKTKV